MNIENSDEVYIEDLPDIYYTISNEIGLENTLKLAKLIGGEYIYLPKSETILKSLRNRQIQKEFNGYNYKHLGKKYNLTEIQIRNICKNIIEKKKLEPMEGQLSLL